MDNQIVDILLVEDDDAHAELISRSFEAYSNRFSLTIVDNLKTAKAYLKNSIPGLVITDMMLPDGRGIELLNPTDEKRDFPMIVMTSFGNEEMAVKAIKLGALDYVVKSSTIFSDLPRIAERALREWKHIIERKRAENQIKASLKEKEILLQQLKDEIKNHKKTEAKLRGSQKLLAEMGTIAKIGGWEVDLETMTPTWTDETKKIYDVDEVPPVEEGIKFYSPESLPIIQKAFEKMIAEGESYDHELQLITAKGQNKWVRTIGTPISNKTGKIIKAIGMIQDITDEKKAKERIKSSLKEKETLLHEVHHRVKNNMQVINSLLKLQSNNIEDQYVKNILKDSQSRIYAMSAVHETLHGSENLSKIDLKSYLSKITSSIFQTYSTDHIKLNSNMENSPIGINQASPLGLIINELISNSLKYAFPDAKNGEIDVRMKKLDKDLELTVMDNGIGMPNNFDWKNSKTLGLKLVRTLVENQLDGSIDMENKNGTKFTIKFNIEN